MVLSHGLPGPESTLTGRFQHRCRLYPYVRVEILGSRLGVSGDTAAMTGMDIG